VLEQLDLLRYFEEDAAVPNVNTYQELSTILREVGAFDDPGLTQSLKQIREITGSEKVSVGIKKVLLAVELAKQNAGNMEGRFAEVLAKHISANQY
jgi:vesicle-fusing ATPase